jgi:hypothetical protein
VLQLHVEDVRGLVAAKSSGVDFPRAPQFHRRMRFPEISFDRVEAMFRTLRLRHADREGIRRRYGIAGREELLPALTSAASSFRLSRALQLHSGLQGDDPCARVQQSHLPALRIRSQGASREVSLPTAQPAMAGWDAEKQPIRRRLLPLRHRLVQQIAAQKREFSIGHSPPDRFRLFSNPSVPPRNLHRLKVFSAEKGSPARMPALAHGFLRRAAGRQMGKSNANRTQEGLPSLCTGRVSLLPRFFEPSTDHRIPSSRTSLLTSSYKKKP